MLPCIAVQGILPEKTYQSAKILALTVGVGGVAVAITLMVGYVAASPTFGWTGGPPQSPVLICTASALACKPVSKAHSKQHLSSACIAALGLAAACCAVEEAGCLCLWRAWPGPQASSLPTHSPWTV